MQSEDRIIHFSTELIHGPVKHPKEVLQKLYYDLSQTTHASYDNIDLSHSMQQKFFSRREKAQSLLLFLPDRAVMIEEWVDIPLKTFLSKVKEVGERVLEVRGASKYTLHTATIRSTFALTHYEDARPYILERVCGQQTSMAQVLHRPLGMIGLKMVFPETEEHTGNIHLTVEPLKNSRNEVYVEAKGIFPKPAVHVRDMDIVTDHIQGLRSFITDRVFPYLNQFDRPEETLL